MKKRLILFCAGVCGICINILAGNLGGVAASKAESPPAPRATQAVQNTRTFPGDLTSAAAEASVYSKCSIIASPHALEDFPWALQGYPPPVQGPQPSRKAGFFPSDLAAAASEASAYAECPIIASPRVLEDFPWALQGFSPPVRTPEPSRNAGTFPSDLATAAAKASAYAKRSIIASPHALEDFPWALQGLPPPTRIAQCERQSRNVYCK